MDNFCYCWQPILQGLRSLGSALYLHGLFALLTMEFVRQFFPFWYIGMYFFLLYNCHRKTNETNKPKVRWLFLEMLVTLTQVTKRVLKGIARNWDYFSM